MAFLDWTIPTEGFGGVKTVVKDRQLDITDKNPYIENIETQK